METLITRRKRLFYKSLEQGNCNFIVYSQKRRAEAEQSNEVLFMLFGFDIGPAYDSNQFHSDHNGKDASITYPNV